MGGGCGALSMAAERLRTVEAAPLVRVCGLSRSYAQQRGLWRSSSHVAALRDVELNIAAGTTLAVVGESGSGKSTLARCVACLEPPDQGEIWFDREELSKLRARELAPWRRRIQMIFQDSAAALSARMTAAAIVAEPLAVRRMGDRRSRREAALRCMERVGLTAEQAARAPLQLSGGQRQRLAIARALVLEPQFLILDEALSGLDLSVQAQIVNLLLALQRDQGLTYLFISHDLGVVRHVADEVAVMSGGRIVERAAVGQLFQEPRHEHTKALLAAIPRMAPQPAARGSAPQ